MLYLCNVDDDVTGVSLYCVLSSFVAQNLDITIVDVVGFMSVL